MMDNMDTSEEEWRRKMKKTGITYRDVNQLIMNYFVVNGNKQAAEIFQAEAGVQCTGTVKLETIQGRMEIQESILSGNMERATGQLNQLDPNLLKENTELYFHCMKQTLIEKIKSGNVANALAFASSILADPALNMEKAGTKTEEYIDQLQEVMLLLIYSKQNLGEKLKKETKMLPELQSLVSQDERKRTAAVVNNVLLTSQDQEPDSVLWTLLHVLDYAQNESGQSSGIRKHYPVMPILIPGLLKYQDLSEENQPIRPMEEE